MITKQNKSKALVLEHKGDKFLKTNKDKKAFESYQKALDLNPERIALYDKLISLHEQYSDNWTDEDFGYNLSLTMKKQELVNPLFKRIHARLEDEYKEVGKLIKKMFDAKTEATETKNVEEIVSRGEDALYPLIDYLLGFKEVGKIKQKAKDKLKKNAPKKKQ